MKKKSNTSHQGLRMKASFLQKKSLIALVQLSRLQCWSTCPVNPAKSFIPAVARNKFRSATFPYSLHGEMFAIYLRTQEFYVVPSFSLLSLTKWQDISKCLRCEESLLISRVSMDIPLAMTRKVEVNSSRMALQPSSKMLLESLPHPHHKYKLVLFNS